jgi:molecular chaperone GrpE
MSEKVNVKITDGTDPDQPETVSENDKNLDAQEVAVEEIASAADEDLATKLEAAEKKAEDYYDRLLRVSAEFDNYKKRTAREIRDTIKFANERIIKELLMVVDNLERAIDAVPAEEHTDNPLLQGVLLTLNEVLKLLERHDVKPIQAMNEPFDPMFHQAMMQEVVADKPMNTVTRELQKGYMIHDRLLRPALVGVSKTGDAATTDDKQ